MLVDEDIPMQHLQSMDHVVNIPIDLAEKRGILWDITSNVNRTKTEMAQENDMGGRSRWKRRIGKDNAFATRTRVSYSIEDRNGLKRQWQLQDEADDMQEENSGSK